MDIEHYNGALAILRAAREHTTYRANGWMDGRRKDGDNFFSPSFPS